MVKIVDLTQEEIDELGLKSTPNCQLIPRRGHNTNKNYCLNLNPVQLEVLRDEARKQKRSLSDLVRRIFNEHIRKNNLNGGLICPDQTSEK